MDSVNGHLIFLELFLIDFFFIQYFRPSMIALVQFDILFVPSLSENLDCVSLTQGIIADLILFKHNKAASPDFDSIDIK